MHSPQSAPLPYGKAEVIHHLTERSVYTLWVDGSINVSVPHFSAASRGRHLKVVSDQLMYAREVGRHVSGMVKHYINCQYCVPHAVRTIIRASASVIMGIRYNNVVNGLFARSSLLPPT
jgi:hypothetical protein